MRLLRCIIGLCVLLVAAPPAGATLISGTYTVSVSVGGPIDPFVASFSITFDNSADISNISTGTTTGITLLSQPAGFTLGSPLAFFYTAAVDVLGVGGLQQGVFTLLPNTFDLAIDIEDASTGTPIITGFGFTYTVEGSSSFFSGDCGGDEEPSGLCSVTFTPRSTSVPEPASLFLLGAGLAGLAGFTWRRHRRM